MRGQVLTLELNFCFLKSFLRKPIPDTELNFCMRIGLRGKETNTCEMYSRKPDFQSQQETPLMAGTVLSIRGDQRCGALLLVSADTRDKCINLVRSAG